MLFYKPNAMKMAFSHLVNESVFSLVSQSPQNNSKQLLNNNNIDEM